MKIHELNSFTGELGDQAYMAVDNGVDTGKVSTTQLLEDVNDAVDLVNTRIDNIISGVTINTEVIDARVGADGVTYGSLGTAIRDQVSLLTGNLTSLGDALINDTNYIIDLNDSYTRGVVHNGAYNNPDSSDTITAYSVLFFKEYRPLSFHLDIAAGYKCLIVHYASASDSSPLTSSWLTGDNVVTDTINTKLKDYFCIEVRKTDNSTITAAEASSAVTAYYSMPLLDDRKKFINITADSTDRLDITESCDIFGNGHTIDVGQAEEFALYVNGDNGVVVNVYDLTIKGGYESAVRVTHYATVNFYNCSFEEGNNHGLSVVNGNTNCYDCIAQNNGVDGFNYHLDGKNTAYDCYALNNGDDGISNHENSSLKISGGRFISNGKAGIAGPTYGAGNTDISNVYCADNVQYGIIIHNDTATTEKVIIQNAILDNSPVGLAVNGYQVITNGVKFVNCGTNTTVGNGGSIEAL